MYPILLPGQSTWGYRQIILPGRSTWGYSRDSPYRPFCSARCQGGCWSRRTELSPWGSCFLCKVIFVYVARSNFLLSIGQIIVHVSQYIIWQWKQPILYLYGMCWCVLASRYFLASPKSMIYTRFPFLPRPLTKKSENVKQYKKVKFKELNCLNLTWGNCQAWYPCGWSSCCGCTRSLRSTGPPITKQSSD